MSRIIIKNLPSNADEKTLEKSFWYGVSRKFAFIGFLNDEAAQNAINKMNGAYIQSSKLQVSEAKPIGDESIERAWSKYNSSSSAYMKNNKKKVVTTTQKKVKTNNKQTSKFIDDLKELAQKRKPIVTNGKRKIVDNDENDENETQSHPEQMDVIDTNSKSDDVDEKIEKEVIKDWDEGRLYITNLPYGCGETEVRQIFEKYGNIAEIHLPVDKVLLFVMYAIPHDAVIACNALNNYIFNGRIIQVNYAKANPYANSAPLKSSSYKDKKSEELKAQAGNQFNWSTLYLRQDTAVSAVAEELGMKKEDILDVNAESMAVRVALAENYVINQTKEYLESHGVNCKVLENAQNEKRSTTIIIVKNLPASSVATEVKNLFETVGGIKFFLMPSSKALALVSFNNSTDAKVAFKRLVYSRYRGVPIYLEWAPENVLRENAVGMEEDLPKDSEAKEVEKGDEEKKEEKEKKGQLKGVEEVKVVEEGSKTLFFKNINFKSKEDTFRKIFEKCGTIHSITLTKKKDKIGEKNQGFGFVEYARHQDAIKAIKTLQGKVIDGHAIQLELSQPKIQDHEHNERKKIVEHEVSHKLMIKNVPFQTNIKEMKDLFRTYGTVRSLRLPQKIDGTNRGFAFVEFATKQEAANAMAALKNSHFYGRHLVIEYAEETELD
ncbi:RRM domain-containing protein [Entamoeba marina]